MKHIILYSGGAASSYVAYLVTQYKNINKKDIILLHTPTYSEHKDADRFRKEVADYLNLNITEQADGRNIWELIDNNNCLPSQFIPFCTQQLKMKQTEKFLKKLEKEKEDYILYIGYGIEEWKRVQNSYAKNLQKRRKVKFPVFESKLKNEEIKRIIQEEWKIELPVVYKHLKHNNCIPCFKAGKYEWKNYWKYYRKEFDEAVKREKQIGHTVFKDKSLTELAEIWEHNEDFEDSQISMDIPCMCSL
jgi:hypothetical protein